uniref:Ig-like domain-containing protein n=1 Tax=Astyanax mexicanus TaxID=7994 RepID=A0A3B1KE47_ASTMX
MGGVTQLSETEQQGPPDLWWLHFCETTLYPCFLHFVSVKTSTFDLQVQTQNIGESVTIKCDQIQDRQYSLAWFKQSFGKLPQLVVRASDSGERFGPTFDQRFRVSSNEGRFDLNIINTMEEDTGTYFCMRVKDNVADFGTGTLLLFSESNVWIVAALSLFSVISVIVIVVLAVLLLKKQQKDTDAVNYAALNFAKKPPPSRTPRTKQTQDIYSQVRVR